MKKLPTTEQLMQMSEEFDEFAMDFCERYDMSPVEMSGVFLARMTRMAEDIGYADLYQKLLKEIGGLHASQNLVSSNTSSTVH